MQTNADNLPADYGSSLNDLNPQDIESVFGTESDLPQLCLVWLAGSKRCYHYHHQDLHARTRRATSMFAIP